MEGDILIYRKKNKGCLNITNQVVDKNLYLFYIISNVCIILILFCFSYIIFTEN